MKKAVVLLSVVSLFFAGCSNFLDGSLLKDTLNDKIGYSDAQTVSVRVGCDPSFGSVYSSADNSQFKVGFPVEVSFSKATGFDENYVYSGFKCVEVDNEETDLNDFIKVDYIKKSVSDGNDSVSLTANITVLKARENLYIMPDIKLIPKVAGIIPYDGKTGVPNNSSIRIQFNKKLECNTENEHSLIKDDGSLNSAAIDIGYGSKRLSSNGYEYYISSSFADKYKGVFSSDGKLLTLILKDKDDYPNETLNKTFVITIKKDTEDSEGCSFAEDYNSLATFLGEVDSLNPKISSFYAYADVESQSISVTENSSKASPGESDIISFNSFVKVNLRAMDYIPPSNLADEQNVSFINCVIKDIATSGTNFNKSFTVDYILGANGACEVIVDPEILENTEGSYSIRFFAEDSAGNTSETSSFYEFYVKYVKAGL